MPNYEKNKNVYTELKGLMPTAEAHSNKLREHYINQGKKLSNPEINDFNSSPKDIVKSNPYTNISDLIDYMEQLSK
jgi:hypothetical protein